MKPDNIRTALFSNVIAYRMTSLGMDVELFARRLGLKHTARAKQWIEGTTLPSVGHLVQIAQVLDMDPADVLLLRAGYPPDEDIPEPEEPLHRGVSIDDPLWESLQNTYRSPSFSRARGRIPHIRIDCESDQWVGYFICRKEP